MDLTPGQQTDYELAAEAERLADILDERRRYGNNGMDTRQKENRLAEINEEIAERVRSRADVGGRPDMMP